MKHFKFYTLKNNLSMILVMFSTFISASVLFGQGEPKKEGGFTYTINNPREPFMPLVSADGTILN